MSEVGPNQRPILIMGGREKTGRRVAERLAAQGVRVRNGSRSGEPPFDWNDERTFVPAVQGAGAASITYYPDLAAPGAADAAVAALVDAPDVGQLFELTGRRLMRFAEAFGAIVAAASRDIGYVRLTNVQFADGLASRQLPRDPQDLVMERFTKMLDGRNTYIIDAIERALGRKPGDFTDYAKTTAATGFWSDRHV